MPQVDDDTIDLLDRTLPPELRGVVPAPQRAVANDPTEKEQMPESTNIAVTPESIKSAAAQVVQEILASRDREAAIAKTVGELTEAKAQAEAKANELKAAIEAAQAKEKDLKQQLEAAQAALTKADDDHKAALATVQDDLKKAQEELATAKKKIAEAEHEAAIARRVEMVNAADLSDDFKNKLIDRAKAAVDGKFTYSDDQLKEQIKDLADAFNAGRGNASKPEGENKQDGNVTPNAPDLTGGVDHAMASAQLLSPIKATASGVNAYAEAFGCGSND